MLEKALHFVTYHSEPIIQWLFFAVLILSATVIARGLFGKKGSLAEVGDDGVLTPAVGAGLVGSSDLQEGLNKIIEQLSKLESIEPEDLNAEGLEEVNSQVAALKKEIKEKEVEIAKLKAGGGSSQATPEAGDFAARIKELEAKLSEYEILEDDIADLSLYKEENARLKEQLEKLSPGTGPIEAVGEAQTTTEAIVEEFAAAVNQASPDSVESEAATVPVTDDPMTDFENTLKVGQEKSEAETSTTADNPSEPAASPAVEAAAVEPAAAPAVEAAAVEPAATPAAQASAEDKDKDDVFAEFANPNPDLPPEEPLDPEKVMNEMADLAKIETTDKSNALEESVDTDKMVTEIVNLNKS